MVFHHFLASDETEATLLAGVMLVVAYTIFFGYNSEKITRIDTVQMTIETSNEQAFARILGFVNELKDAGVKIIERTKEMPQRNAPKGIDLSSFSIQSFKQTDGMTYQRKMRDEW